jgi:hypothetical protein
LQQKIVIDSGKRHTPFRFRQRYLTLKVFLKVEVRLTIFRRFDPGFART